MMARKKTNTKVLTQAKRRRRRLITFMRMVRYGVNSLGRNAWLTIAATAVMTITLLIIFATVVARDVLTNTVQTIQDGVDMTVYIQSDAEEAEVSQVASKAEALESVRQVSVLTPDDAREQFIKDNQADPQTLNSLNNSDPEFPWRLRIKMVDMNETDELRHFVDTDEQLSGIISQSDPPSFAGPQRTAIERIGGAVRFADRAGVIAGSVFIIISSLIIFNTIRMAIFNRREEIQMMKLIGAERSFIRGPFVVEAIIYGFIAAIFATGLGIFAVYSVQDVLRSADVMVEDTIAWLLTYSPLVLLAMILIGSIIGVISSLLATHRYLRV